jgi:hypothetical protein
MFYNKLFYDFKKIIHVFRNLKNLTFILFYRTEIFWNTRIRVCMCSQNFEFSRWSATSDRVRGRKCHIWLRLRSRANPFCSMVPIWTSHSE